MRSTPTARQIVGKSILYGLLSAIGGAIGRTIGLHPWVYWLIWVIAVGECLLGAFVGIRFWRGDARFIDWMDQDGPDSVRLLPILGIPIAIFVLPLVLVVGAVFVWPPVLADWAVGSLGFGLAAWGFAAFGVIMLMAYRPPFWLIPPWILAQDRYAPIELRSYRRSLLVGGVLSLLAAGLAIVASIAIWVVRS